MEYISDSRHYTSNKPELDRSHIWEELLQSQPRESSRTDDSNPFFAARKGQKNPPKSSDDLTIPPIDTPGWERKPNLYDGEKLKRAPKLNDRDDILSAHKVFTS